MICPVPAPDDTWPGHPAVMRFAVLLMDEFLDSVSGDRKLPPDEFINFLIMKIQALVGCDIPLQYIGGDSESAFQFVGPTRAGLALSSLYRPWTRAIIPMSLVNACRE